MTIQKDSVVSIHYTLTTDNGEVIDSSKGQEPLTYIQGHQNIIPGLENALAGKTTGDKLQVKVSPDQGYGVRNEDLVQTLNKSQFEAAGEIEVGMRFQAQSPDGHMLLLTVIKIDGDNIIVDGNHELAGVNLNFDVEITETRAATKDELAHGHVHGAGCNH